MTSSILQTELSNLIQESKRKNPDLKNAAEHSLNDLKALPSTSEAQLAADLVRKLHFARPFVIACHTRHAKLAPIGVVCIQRMVTSRSLPVERLKDVLDGLRETTSLGLDVQLKVLQTLSSLFQYYAGNINGELLASTLEICATLQNSKTVAVSNTAAATLQQLVVSVFENISIADEKPSTGTVTVSIEDGNLEISPSSYDALRILDDLCRLLEGEKLEFLNIKSLSRIFVLELIESVLAGNDAIFRHHPEQVQVLRNRLMPLAVRYLAERHSFSLTVRVARILLLLLKDYLSLLAAECEMALGLLIYLLDADSAPPWKRVLCMEIFRSLYSEPGLTRHIYVTFDEQEGRKNIVREHMASLVRLASEKPSLIGVSHQSTLPVGPETSQDTIEDQLALEAVGVAGVLGSTSTTSSACGISSQWSLVRTPYLETLDKVDAPTPPDTYIYTLVLNCISAFSESIAKFILPLTVAESRDRRRGRGSTSKKGDDIEQDGPQRSDSAKGSRKSSVPLNPLDLAAHPQIDAIQESANMIDSCWPAILAACSTFLYAALDAEFYHNLVRSFQKLTHVAGLLRLGTPRDAFLTTLGKAAVPADLHTMSASTPIASPNRDTQHTLTAESPIPRSPSVSDLGGPAVDSSAGSLSTRNLLCLRALLNLGIALGPTLDQAAWSIVLETLQHAELVIGVSTISTPRLASGNQNGESSAPHVVEGTKGNLVSEVMAVQTAAAKMFESAGDYPSIQFKSLLLALWNLSRNPENVIASLAPEKSLLSPRPSQAPHSHSRMHQNKRSISIALGRSRVRDDELKFVLEKVNNLAVANLERLALPQDDEGIWQTLTTNLISVSQDGQVSHSLRLKAGDVLDRVVFHSIKLGNLTDETSRNQIQTRGLRALKAQISTLYEPERRPSSSLRATDFEVHEQGLETLKAVLEECGESLVAGWDLVFDLISSVFDEPAPIEAEENAPSGHPSPKLRGVVVVKSPKLVRTAYNSLQLIASDFLALLPPAYLLELVGSFSNFASQKEDFNISLTTSTAFWNVSDFLRSQIDNFSIEGNFDVTSSEETLIALAKGDDASVAKNALWLLLLLRIVDLSTDSRSEIRNSGIHTALRIVDAYGPQLPPQAWQLCMNRVLFVMAESAQMQLVRIIQTSKSLTSDETKQWIETTVVMTKGLSTLIGDNFDAILQSEDFEQSWTRLLQYFDSIIKIGLLELSEATFSSFAEVLSRIPKFDSVGLDSLHRGWSVWASGHPISRERNLEPETPNQDALLAYVRSFKQLYRLLHSKLSDTHINQILDNLQLAVWESVPSRYSMDVDHQSELQALVIECIKTLCLDRDYSQPAIATCLAKFTDSALTKVPAEQGPRGPTFVAFSKASIQLLGWYITTHGIKSDLFSKSTLSIALEHLANPILQKYTWTGKDHEPVIWRIATTTSLDILQVAIPYVEKQYQTSDRGNITRFWKCVVDICRGIVSVQRLEEQSISASTISSDESFDIESFNRLRELTIPSLGSAHISDKLRRDFACSLFSSSLLYPLQPFDMHQGTIEAEPLQDLYKVRLGRTYDPPPTLRSGIAYVLIDTLFDLSSTSSLSTALSQPLPPGGSPASSIRPAIHNVAPYIALAKAVSPYLILRCAIPLKAYIADQPLRGLMPQPTPARDELLYLLRRLVALKSEPAAIPSAGPAGGAQPAVAGEDEDEDEDLEGPAFKKHLGWVYPLVVKAIPVAGKEAGDSSVLESLENVLSRWGGEEVED
ncbi:hypothetical protein AJ80_05269 [Polytolypa hystricis UAMH7299]|uniref:Protein MON2 homolog n=1 Tax=Polytolypa hystricis (strain UAMH7299) TaxID=1447883 RepID=A0A2B7Y431_POLH7|nr:hypothetical protein AJ80_05269 [Polytolypa hystricis UAMH7299]